MVTFQKIKFSELDLNLHFPNYTDVEYAGYVDVLQDRLYYVRTRRGHVPPSVTKVTSNKRISIHTHDGSYCPSLADLMYRFLSSCDEDWILSQDKVNVLRPLSFRGYHFGVYGNLLQLLPDIMKTSDPQEEFNGLFLHILKKNLGRDASKIAVAQRGRVVVKIPEMYNLLMCNALGSRSQLYNLRGLQRRVANGGYHVKKRDDKNTIRYLEYMTSETPIGDALEEILGVLARGTNKSHHFNSSRNTQ